MGMSEQSSMSIYKYSAKNGHDFLDMHSWGKEGKRNTKSAHIIFLPNSSRHRPGEKLSNIFSGYIFSLTRTNKCRMPWTL